MCRISATRDGATTVLVSQVQYQPFGGVKSYVTGAGQTVTRSFDLDGRISSYSLGGRTMVVGHDAASNIAAVVDAAAPANTSNYRYDNLDRLTQSTGPATSQGYDYDLANNRSSQTTGPNRYGYAISGDSNRLTQVTGRAPATAMALGLQSA